MKTLVKLENGKEVSRKSGYSNLENATNAGNSWKKDCRVHKTELDKRSFFVIDSESEKVKKEIIETVSNNVIDYFANSISASNFIEKHIKSITTVSDAQEEKICNILSEYDREFANADCDEEGATREQDAELDRIIEKCANAIYEIF